MSPGKYAKLLKYLARRDGPNGLVSLAYINPYASTTTKTHRNIWLAGKPKVVPLVLWLLLQVYLWISWTFFFAWLNIFTALSEFSEQLSKQTRISKATQFVRLVRFTVGWGAHGEELYRYGVVENPCRFPEFIYSKETRGWHSLQNRDFAPTLQEHLLLENKVAFSEKLISIGFPAVPSLFSSNHTNKKMSDILSHLQYPVFVKAISGNRAKGAFQVLKIDPDMTGLSYHGQSMNSLELEAAFQSLLRNPGVLIQRQLENHKKLLQLCETQTAITVRFVTFNSSTKFKDYKFSQLEFPQWLDDSKEQIHYFILPVDLEEMKVSKPQDFDLETPRDQRKIKTLLSQSPNPIPYFSDLMNQSIEVHENHFPSFWAIAWDWIITDDGPLLLEGNVGWGLETYQLQHGGLLNV